MNKNCSCSEDDCLDCWPNCFIPMCKNKCCRALDSAYCHPHSFYVGLKELELINELKKHEKEN